MASNKFSDDGKSVWLTSEENKKNKDEESSESEDSSSGEDADSQINRLA